MRIRGHFKTTLIDLLQLYHAWLIEKINQHYECIQSESYVMIQRVEESRELFLNLTGQFVLLGLQLNADISNPSDMYDQSHLHFALCLKSPHRLTPTSPPDTLFHLLSVSSRFTGIFSWLLPVLMTQWMTNCQSFFPLAFQTNNIYGAWRSELCFCPAPIKRQRSAWVVLCCPDFRPRLWFISI